MHRIIYEFSLIVFIDLFQLLQATKGTKSPTPSEVRHENLVKVDRSFHFSQQNGNAALMVMGFCSL